MPRNINLKDSVIYVYQEYEGAESSIMLDTYLDPIDQLDMMNIYFRLDNKTTVELRKLLFDFYIDDNKYNSFFRESWYTVSERLGLTCGSNSQDFYDELKNCKTRKVKFFYSR